MPGQPKGLIVSARDAEGLKEEAKRYFRDLEQRPGDVDQICQESAKGDLGTTPHLVWPVVGHCAQELSEELSKDPPVAKDFETMHKARSYRNMLFLYSGQGAQLDGWWLELYAANSTFSTALDRICEEALSVHGVALSDSLGLKENSHKKDIPMAHMQPLIFSIQVALTESWAACGIYPDSVMGHSFGEFAAAVATGALHWKDALAIVIKRATLMSQLPPDGAMLVVYQSKGDTTGIIRQVSANLATACVNAPTVTVASGAASEIAKVEKHCQAKEITTARLATKHAFHSPQMRPMLAEFGQFVQSILDKSEPGASPKNFKTPRFISTVSSRPTTTQELRQSEYWISHVEKAVDLVGALGVIGKEKTFGTVVEIGPSSTLLGGVKRCLQKDLVPAVLASSLGKPEPKGRSTFFARSVSQVLRSPWGLSNLKLVLDVEKHAAEGPGDSPAKLTSGSSREMDGGVETQNEGGAGYRSTAISSLIALILPIFDTDPLEEQPKVLVDNGCGSGLMLKRLYEAIVNRSSRGKQIKNYPLLLVGIDSTLSALKDCETTLQEYPHHCFQGNTGDPSHIFETVKFQLGVTLDDVLHVRCFLEHGRQYMRPVQKNIPVRFHHETGVFTGAPEQAISCSEMQQNLVEHMQRLSGVMGRHGMVVAEEHFLSPCDLANHKRQLEGAGLNDDGVLSGQCLTDARSWIRGAAEASLMSTSCGMTRLPEEMSYARITLNHFRKKEFCIRPPVIGDLDELFELEKRCWEENIRSSRQQIRARIEKNPDGQFILVMDGKICGALYTQKISDPELVYQNGTATIEDHHKEDNPCLQLLALNVEAEFSVRGFGKQLISFCLSCAKVTSNIQRIVAVTRCKHFSGQNVDALSAYVNLETPTDRPLDPILAFHWGNGAKIWGLVDGYRPLDARNFGCGVLIEYQLSAVRELIRANEVEPAYAKGTQRFSTPTDASKIVEEALCSIMGITPLEVKEILTTGWMSAGMDSLNLMQLKSWLDKALGTDIDPEFFFEFPTPAKAMTVLNARIGAGNASGATNRTSGSSEFFPETHDSQEGIAVIGMACKLPGVEGPDEFWKLLSSGEVTVGPVPTERSAVTPQVDGIGGWFKDVSAWDPDVHNVSESAAKMMDPQQRFMFDVSWSALEHAGINPETVAGTRTGVYFGVFTEDYREVLSSSPELVLSPYFGTGTSASCVAGNVAHRLDTRGPAITTNTACSSSLVAVSQAHKALLSGECDMAIAGGVNVVLSKTTMPHYRSVGILSPTDTCRTLDEDGDGTVIGEGAGAVVCKRLSQAVRDGDRILAVIPSSTLNQDGRTSVLTAPSPEAQRNLLIRTLNQGGLDGDDIDYVELHGTGTKLGDPIELNQITSVLQDSGRTRPVTVGSVKANVGHLFSAAGVVALIKVILCIQNKSLVPQPNFSKMNRKIVRTHLIEIPRKLLPWVESKNRSKDGGAKRRAAVVSSFGFMGTNSQVSVLEPPPISPLSTDTAASHSQHILTLSAKSEASLALLVGRYKDLWSEKLPLLDIGDCCFTSNVGRSHFSHRMAFVVQEHSDLVAALSKPAPIAVPDTRPLAFAFDVGSFLSAEHVHSCLSQDGRLLQTYLQVLTEMGIFPQDLESPASSVEVDAPNRTFAFFLACYRWWAFIGLVPTYVTGRGLGVLVGAVISNTLSLKTALGVLADLRRLESKEFLKSASEKSRNCELDVPEWVEWSDGEASCVFSCDALQDTNSAKPVSSGFEGLSQNLRTKTLAVGFGKSDVNPAAVTIFTSRDAEIFAPSPPSAVALLYARGREINWAKYHRTCAHKKADIPTYAYNPQRFWALSLDADSHPLLGTSKKEGGATVWTRQWNAAVVEYLSNHRVREMALVPGTCYMEMVGPAVEELFGDVAYELTEVRFEGVLALQEDRLPTLRLTISPAENQTADSGDWHVRIESRTQTEEDWSLHATMKLGLWGGWKQPLDLGGIKARCTTQVDCGAPWYEMLGNAYRGDFRSLQTAWQGAGEVVGQIVFDGEGEEGVQSQLRSCAWLDCSIHVAMVAFDFAERLTGLYLTGLQSFKACGTRRQSLVEVWCLAEGGEGGGPVNLTVMDQEGSVLAQFVGLRIGRLEGKLRQCAAVDEWMALPEAPELDSSVEVLRPVSVTELHGAIKARMEVQPRLCVVARNDEFAGYLRTLRLEYPSWEVTCIQAQDEVSAAPKEAAEEDWLLQNGNWSVRRLNSIELHPAVCSVSLRGRGELSMLELVEAERVQPAAGYVELRVFAVGLNFRDVLNVLGMYPGDPGPPGGDCAGVVTAVGKGVDSFKEGDRVFGVAWGSLHAYVMAHSSHLRPLPPNMSYNSAATLPIVDTTVHYALVDLSKLQKGQKVLVHAAAGGIGLTAIHYAHKLGCEVIATAGAESKRSYLRSLGVTKIASSRDADSFKASMEEYGQVDVVLNSLSGDFITHSLAALKEGGHFCEIGKRGIWTHAEVAAARPDIHYHIIAIDGLLADDPERFRQLLADAVSFGPPSLPTTVFPIHRSVEAFKYLQEAKHIGKVVIEQPPLISKESAYIITGGLGYLGRLVADALIEQGARNLVLLSSTRSDLPEDWGRDVRPVVEKCDVGDLEQVRAVVKKYSNLRGIIHAAGVLADKTLPQLTEEDFKKVYRPKVDGARYLHECTQGMDLDFFVMFSSIASGFGLAGQANYAAANGCLDALALERQKNGQPGLSVRWGAWAGGGMASESTLRRFAQSGILPLSQSIGIEALLQLMFKCPSPVVTVCPLDPSKLSSSQYFEKVRVSKGAGKTGQGGGGWTDGLLKMSVEERQHEIRAMIQGEASRVARVLNLEGSIPWGKAGLDSLSMVELRNALQRQLGDAMLLSSTALFDYPNLDEMAKHIEDTLLPTLHAASAALFFAPASLVEPMAIVGMACRLPGGCSSPKQFWSFLEDRGNGLVEIPLSRIDWRRWFSPDRSAVGKSYTNRGGFVSGLTLFDHKRFSISGSEADVMDPAQRLSLETAYEAMQQAGLGGEGDKLRNVGVFVGKINESDRELASIRGSPDPGPYTATGEQSSICANRISHAFGFKGPSMTIDTACSSSLVALDGAIKAMRNNDCEAAVVLGVNLIFTMDNYVAFSSANMLSPRGRCATFSDEADGYARGEGCGAIILKPLSKAKEAGDAIWGLVQSAAVNQDGRTATLTAPNGPAQEQVVKTALQRAGITPDDVAYVEAHGTGTPLGDPQEVGALTNVFKGRKAPLVLGALKANIGHLEGAAGVAGLIKAVLCLHHGRVPPNINCERLNPLLEPLMEQCSFVFPRESTVLKGRYAGVSSFGFGGTNSHVVLAAAPEGSPMPQHMMVDWDRQAFPYAECPHPLLGKCQRDSKTTVWTRQWDESVVSYLTDHRVRDIPLVPATCYMEIVAPAVEQLFGDVPYELRDVQFKSILYLEMGRQPTVRVSLEASRSSEEAVQVWGVSIESTNGANDGWELHAMMKLSVGQELTKPLDLEEIIKKCPEQIDCGDDFYSTVGNAYQGDFRSLKSVRQGNGEWLGEIEMSDDRDTPVFLRTCAWLDCSIQVALVNLEPDARLAGLFVAGVDSYQVAGTCRKWTSTVFSHLTDNADGTVNVSIVDSRGRMLANVHGLHLGRMEAKATKFVGVDEWVICSDSPALDTSVETIYPTAVGSLHSAVLERMESQRPLCVVAPDEELAAYVRCLRAEYPSWEVSCVMGDRPKAAPAAADEGDWLWSEGKWSVRRYRNMNLLPLICSVRMRARGELSMLQLVEAERNQPPPGLVEMRVHAVGLNFRDVLNVLGMYPGDPGPPGGDCAGVITAVGEGVGSFKVGDEVFGVGKGSLEAYVHALPQHVRKMPAGMSFEACASLPVLITTVHQALLDLSKLQKGQKVLVHAAAGGIGLTAIHYAHKLGCEVIATAGAESKREFVRSLGVTKIASSRDADSFKASMEEYGQVDVVLNSLSGKFITHSLAALKEGGHFCEIGKRGIWTHAEAAAARPDIHYHTIAIDAMMAENPDGYQVLFGDSMAFGPPSLPTTVFPIHRSVEAFKYLQEAKHIGKVVLSQPPLVRLEAAYIITGGLGYLGRLVADALIEQGARNLVLLSSTRSDLPEDWGRDVRPVVEKCDVGDLEQVRAVVKKYSNLRGIIHAAGVLADKTLPQLTEEDFKKVYRPKVDGARYLHECTQGMDLDFFVMFSSIASGFGNSGQANYAAANGCLDALALERQKNGQPGLSVRWGAWAGGGMASDATLQRIARSGLLPLKPDLGIQAMFQLMSHQQHPVVTVCPLDGSKLPAKAYFGGVRVDDKVDGEDLSGSSGWATDLTGLGEVERTKAVQSGMTVLVSRVSGEEGIDSSMTWGQLGLDSLSMVELRNALKRELGNMVQLTSTALFDYPTMDALVKYIVNSLSTKTNVEPNVGSVKVAPTRHVEPMAIVGMACRLPGGCNSPDELWDFLERSGDGVEEIPLSRIDWRGSYDPDGAVDGTSYTNKGAFVKNINLFDHKRFGISAVEAELMDPQHRIALETAYEAMEQAGLSSSRRLDAEIGVFVAECSHDFELLNGKAAPGPYTATGSASSICANRISHAFGLKGPSMTIDTACSSSLVAVNTACNAMYNNDCETAVVLGVNLNLSMHMWVNFSSANMLSPRGRCATFSDEADGYARGEGCGAIILKPLSKAKEAGDAIWGLVQSAAVNQDGRTATLTAPNGPAQEQVVKTALQRAGITPDDVAYVEAHGTGTPLGDPQEVGALTNVFKGRKAPLVLGALKANIGHLEGAAGVAGLIKAVLCLHHGRVPPNINCERLNPLLEPLMEQCSFVFPRESTVLKGRYAGVSSFGFGGTNSHVVLATAPDGCVRPLPPQIKWNKVATPWKATTHPLLGTLEKRSSTSFVWKCKWDTELVKYLSQHRVRKEPLVSRTAFLEMVAPAVEELFGDVPYELFDIRFESILYLDEHAPPKLRMKLDLDDREGGKGDSWNVTIESQSQQAFTRLSSARDIGQTQPLSGESTWTMHAFMSLQLCQGWDENVVVETITGRCAETIECGGAFYETLSNTYEGDFGSLQRVWQGARESVGLIESEDETEEAAPASLKACAWLVSAMHVGLVRLDAGERRAGLYIEDVRRYRSAGTSRRALSKVYSYYEIVDRDGRANVTLVDSDGRVLSQLEGVKAGQLEVKVDKFVSVDEWMLCSKHVVLDPTIEMLRPTSVKDLHAAVLQRMKEQAPLCVLAKDEEIAGYIRCLRDEFSGWDATCVMGDSPGAGPAATETCNGEFDWLFKDGHWFVRRFRWLRSFQLQADHSHILDAEASYLITGGLGYLGRMVAEALIEQGARKLVLLSSTKSDLPRDWDLEVRPAVEKCDVGDLEQVRKVVKKHPNLRGIIHAAGVLADKLIPNLAEDDFKTVYGPKVHGARNLHETTQDLELDFFILFSSIASGFGSAGQANYAAANGCLDALAAERNRKGLCGLSLRWGAWTGGGMASEATFRRVEQRGVLPIDPHLGIQTMLQLMSQYPSPIVTVCPFDFKKSAPRKYLEWVQNDSDPKPGKSHWEDGRVILWAEELRGMNSDDRLRTIEAQLKVWATRVGAEPDFESTTTWVDAGLDSLSMVELRNALRRELGGIVSLSNSLLYDFPTLGALAQHIDKSLALTLDVNVGSVATSLDHETPGGVSFDLEAWLPLTSVDEDFLECLREGEPNYTPIVFIYGGLGLSFGSQLVPHIIGYQPIYSTQAPDYVCPKYDCFEERVVDHAEALMARFSVVGVHLVAFSLGAQLAVAIAHELETANLPFTITLIDPAPAYTPLRLSSVADSRAFILGKLSASIDVLQGVDWNSLSDNRTLDKAITKIFGHESEDARLIRRMSYVFGNLANTVLRDPPQYLADVDVTIFILSGGTQLFDDIHKEGYNNDGVYGWSDVFRTATRVDAIGDHFSFFANAQNVQALARHLAEAGRNLYVDEAIY